MSRTLDQFSVDLQSLTATQFRSAVLKEVKGLSFRVEAKAKLNATSGPHVRSGRLRSSIKARTIEGTDQIGLELSAGPKYARMQEYGGTIFPKSSKFLTVPLPAAQTGSGDLKAEFAGGFRSVSGLFVFRSKAGNLILARRKDKELEPLAVLKPSVTLYGWRYLTRAMESEVPGFKDRLAKSIKALVETGRAP